MSNLFLTLVIAFVIIVFAIAFLATAWLIAGKTKVIKSNSHPDLSKKQDENLFPKEEIPAQHSQMQSQTSQTKN